MAGIDAIDLSGMMRAMRVESNSDSDNDNDNDSTNELDEMTRRMKLMRSHKSSQPLVRQQPCTIGRERIVAEWYDMI